MDSKLTIEVDPRHEGIVRRALALAEEMEQLALTAKERFLVSAVGAVAFTRRYWKCPCGVDGSYAADAILGVAGERYTKAVQKHCCRLAADMSLASSSENLHEMLGVDVCPETVRKVVEGHGQKMARFQSQDTASEEAFRKAEGEVEFTTDAGKVNTRAEGWKDLKIAGIAERKAGKPASPEEWKSQRLPLATIVLAFAMIAKAKEFRTSWRPRLRRLGVTCMASIQVLADGASWIWKAVGRVLTGCVPSLDFYHACQHLNRCAERGYGEGTTEKRLAYRYARGLLRRQGRAGVCQWVSALLAVEEERERERRRKATDRLIGYFAKHTTRLNYAERLQAGRALGSGQVEAKAKTLGLRLKARGARWRSRNVLPGQSGVRPPQFAMGSLLGHSRLVTPREVGYTPLLGRGAWFVPATWCVSSRRRSWLAVQRVATGRSHLHPVCPCPIVAVILPTSLPFTIPPGGPGRRATQTPLPTRRPKHFGPTPTGSRTALPTTASDPRAPEGGPPWRSGKASPGKRAPSSPHKFSNSVASGGRRRLPTSGHPPRRPVLAARELSTNPKSPNPGASPPGRVRPRGMSRTDHAPAVGGLVFPRSKSRGLARPQFRPARQANIPGAATRHPSCRLAAEDLRGRAGSEVGDKHRRRRCKAIGDERGAERAAQVVAYRATPWTAREGVPAGARAPAAAAAGVDGGRLPSVERVPNGHPAKAGAPAAEIPDAVLAPAPAGAANKPLPWRADRGGGCGR